MDNAERNFLAEAETKTFTICLTAVDNVEAGMSVRVIEHTIEVTAVSNQTISLLDATGKLLATESDTRTARFIVPQAGIYILRGTGYTVKVMVP